MAEPQTILQYVQTYGLEQYLSCGCRNHFLNLHQMVRGRYPEETRVNLTVPPR